MWDGVVPALAAEHRVIRPDLRGFGGSPPPGEPYTGAGDLLRVLDAAGLERVAMVGASNGGRVACEFAAVHGARLTSLALLNPPLLSWDWSAEMGAYGDAEEAALERGDVAAAVELNLDMWVRGPARPWDATLRAHGETLREAMRVALVNQSLTDEFEESAKPDLADDLGAVRTPTLVAVGEADVPDFRRIAERLAAELPDGRLSRLGGVGHLPAVEQPDVTARLLLSFLREFPA
ncbi:alpha/beta hydrolase [Streptomyces profundus]|nr:alpha/beta hydrolase [Streptomyces sp. MA3_2.13]